MKHLRIGIPEDDDDRRARRYQQYQQWLNQQGPMTPNELSKEEYQAWIERSGRETLERPPTMQTQQAGEARQATEMDARPVVQQQFDPGQVQNTDMLERQRVGKDWTRRIKTVPKAAEAPKARDLRSFEPSPGSRGLRQAENQHQHISSLLGASAEPLRALDGKIASFAVDQRSATATAELVPAITDALAQREAVVGPAAARIHGEGSAEEKQRFAIYERWASDIVAIAERRAGHR